MNMMLTKPRAVLASATLLALMSSTSAFALEGKALFDKLMENSKATITYDNLIEEGTGSFTMTGVKIASPANDGATMEKLSFTNLREDGEDVAFDAASVEGFKVADEGRTTTMTSMSMGDASMPRKLLQADALADPANRTGRVKLGSMKASGLETDLNNDGTVDNVIASIGIDGLDVPLDWRLGPNLSGTASGPPADPMLLSSLTLEGFDANNPDGTAFTLGSFALNGVRMPTTFDVPVEELATIYRDIAVGPLSASRGGKRFFAWDNLSASVTPGDGSSIRTSSKLDGLFADLTAAPNADPNMIKALNDLGYAQLTASAVGNGSYDIKTGRVAVEEVSLDVKDLAKLSMSYVMTGYTPEVARAINQISTASAGGGQPDFGKLFTVLSDLKLESVNVAVQDQSGTKKILDYFAQQQGATGEQLAQQGPLLVTLGMKDLNMPEFTKQVADAVGSYLMNPGTLSIKVEPETPPTLSQLVQAGMQSPKFLVDLLDVKVEATN